MKRDIILSMARSADQGELLVVGAEAADPLVGQHLTARVVHDLADVGVFLLRVPLLVGMRPPHQPAYVDSSSGGLGENRTQFRAWSGQSLASVPPPVEEPHLIRGAEGRELLVQPGEVGGPVNQGRDGVPIGQASTVPLAPVDRRHNVAALLGAQEPLLGHRHWA
jgi:hypothetical protein